MVKPIISSLMHNGIRYAGLFGPIVIYKPGMMDQEHISREIITAILGKDHGRSDRLPFAHTCIHRIQ